MEIKLLQEEVNEIKQIKERTAQLSTDLGEISLQKLKLEIIESALKETLKNLIVEEQKLADDLFNKYGDISVDVEKGIATKIT